MVKTVKGRIKNGMIEPLEDLSFSEGKWEGRT